MKYIMHQKATLMNVERAAAMWSILSTDKQRWEEEPKCVLSLSVLLSKHEYWIGRNRNDILFLCYWRAIFAQSSFKKAASSQTSSIRLRPSDEIAVPPYLLVLLIILTSSSISLITPENSPFLCSITQFSNFYCDTMSPNCTSLVHEIIHTTVRTIREQRSCWRPMASRKPKTGLSFSSIERPHNSTLGLVTLFDIE